MYLDSQTSLYNLFSQLIEQQTIQANLFNSFNTPDSKLQEITCLANQVSWKQRKALNIWFSRLLKDLSRSSSGLFCYNIHRKTQIPSLRNSLETFWGSSNYLLDLEFKYVKTGSSIIRNLGSQDKFRLSVSMPTLEETNFISWQQRDEYVYKKGLIQYNYNNFKSSNRNNFVKLAIKIIERFGTDGKILIQPATSTNDPNLGYQHLVTSKRLKALPYLPYEEKTVFEVDLGRIKEARYVLEHIAHLMDTFNMAFIFKEWVDIDKEYNYYDNRIETMKAYFNDHKEIITAVDFDGFLRIEDIFSGYSRNEQIIMDGYITDSEGNTFFDLTLREICKDFKTWDDVWTIIMGLNAHTFGIYYFNEIRANISPKAQFLYDLLKRY